MPSPADRRARVCARARGLTMLEVVIGFAVLCVLVSLAVPSFSRQLDRHRLQAAAEALAADLSEARFQAARRGQAVQVAAQAGSPWCWAVSVAPDCPCATAQACQLKSVHASDHRGVHLQAASVVNFNAEGRADLDFSAQLEAGGQRLRVAVGRLGRAYICDPDGHHPRLPAC